MTTSVPNAAASVPLPANNPYKAWLGGLTIALNALALIGLLMVMGGGYSSVPSGTMLLVSCGSLGTLFLLSWLIVGAVTWRPAPER